MEVNAAFIKQKRTKNGWTQQHLADACSVSLRTIQRVERYGQASNETVASLSSVFEVERAEIIEFSEETDASSVQDRKFSLLNTHLIGYLCGLISGIVITYLAHSG